jgi:hypothetical protein
MLQKIAINSKSSGRFKSELINGRSHIVTNMLSLEGDSIMNDLFYPMDEVKSALSQLHMLPAPAGHPEVSGENISAFHPLALNANHFGGFIRNPRLEGKRVINELVIDEEVAERSEKGQTIINSIRNGQKLGVSTGLKAHISNSSGNYAGKRYKGAVSDIDFDHVAVLLDEAPAGDTTYTLNKGVRMCNINETKGVKIMHEKLELDISALALEDRMKLTALSPEQLANAVNRKIAVDEAKAVIEGAGLQVNSISKQNVDEFLSNKEQFEAFKAQEQEKLDEMKDFILKNSKMTDEQLDGMSKGQLESIADSVTPKNNFMGNAGSAGDSLDFTLM